MLASVALGATWSSCSPDFGFRGVMDRFGQVRPKVLFSADGYFYNGKTFDSLARVAEIKAQIESIEQVVVVPFTNPAPDLGPVPGAKLFTDLTTGDSPPEISFAQLPAEHPLYILYSSGTTGVPKCMVHGAANVLVQHFKELSLHTDLKREDRIFYFTTCGWMMWNWLVSSLALGATLMLFDGSPFYPGPEVLWEYAAQEKISIFGTSARYLAAIENEGPQAGQAVRPECLEGHTLHRFSAEHRELPLRLPRYKTGPVPGVHQRRLRPGGLLCRGATPSARCTPANSRCASWAWPWRPGTTRASRWWAKRASWCASSPGPPCPSASGMTRTGSSIMTPTSRCIPTCGSMATSAR